MITLHKPDNWKKIPLPGLRAWITALRSGEFKQGNGALKTDLGYCCLGLLSHIQGRLTEMKPGFWADSAAKGDHRAFGQLYEDNPCVLAGLQTGGAFPEGIYIARRSSYGGGSAILRSLAYANDCGVSFAEIADVLEEIYCDSSEQ